MDGRKIPVICGGCGELHGCGNGRICNTCSEHANCSFNQLSPHLRGKIVIKTCPDCLIKAIPIPNLAKPKTAGIPALSPA